MRKIRRNTKRKRSLSETKEYRLLQTCLRVPNFNGNIRRVKVALDTQSNVSYAEPYLGTPREWRSHESKLVKGIGGYSRSSQPLTTTVIVGDQAIPIDTRSPPKGMFNKNIPDRPQILLCAEHCAVLRIDLNAALRTLAHKDARFIPLKEKHVCFISEKLMTKYLDKTGGSDKEPK